MPSTIGSSATTSVCRTVRTRRKGPRFSDHRQRKCIRIVSEDVRLRLRSGGKPLAFVGLTGFLAAVIFSYGRAAVCCYRCKGERACLPGEVNAISGILRETTRCANIDASSASAKGVLHMGMLDELLAGGQLQREYKDFVNRHEQGDPSEGYSDQEVLQRYGEVSHAVPPDQYAQAAQEALSKLSPEERAAFVKMLQDRAAARGVTLQRQLAPEPKDLGQVLTDLHVQPGQLRDILGAGDAQTQQQASGSSPIIDILTSPMAKAVLAGIAAMVVKNVMGGTQRT